jgi:spore maturation protein CgeB
MRIFLVLAASPNPAFASSLWKSNLHDPLVRMGHDVVLFEEGVLPLFDLDPAAASTREPRARFSERLTAAVEAAHRAAPLDLVLTYVSDSHVEPGAIAQLRERLDAPVVNFFCNNVHQFHLVRRIAPAFDLCLVPEHEALERYDEAGAKPLYWPMAADPLTYAPREGTPDLGATFAGQRYGDRTTLMLALLEAGVDAHAFGQGWEPERAIAANAAEASGPLAAAAKLARDALHGRRPWVAMTDRAAWASLRSRHAAALHGPVDDAEYVALFSRSRINLGFLVLGDTHRTLRPLRQVRLREFEATMAGGFYLTGWLPELAQLYELGREIETYRSRAELVDKCRFYLAHDEAREKVRHAGHVRARRDHTWERRFESLFAELRRRGLLKGA